MMTDLQCELCGKYISDEEATNSSIVIRYLFCQGSEDDTNLIECYNHDFCRECANKFKSKEQFNQYVDKYNQLIQVYTRRG